MGVGCGEQVSGEGHTVPLPRQMFLVFDLKMVNFGVF